MFKQNKQAFTLVELIVVITILAILGTISFISLQGYSASARDSRRISDISNIKKSLELFSINTGKYPLPDNPTKAKYLLSTIWTQGTVGDDIATNLSRNLNKKPTDPLTEQEYTYSVTYSQTEYEVLAIYESDIVSYNYLPLSGILSPGQGKEATFLVSKTNAATAAYPKIDGTYNGVAVKTPEYIIPTPSIINAELPVSDEIELNGTTIQSQIVTGGNNSIESSTGELDIINFEVYEIPANGVINNQEVGTIIQNTYSGSTDLNTGIYAEIVSISDSNELVELVDSVVLNPTIFSTSESANIEIVYSDCIAGTINGETYIGVEYFYNEMNHLETTTGTGIDNITEGVKSYSADVICNDGYTSIENEFESIECNPGNVVLGGECVADICTGVLPNNATLNGAQSISYSWVFNETPGTCTFECDTNYFWNGSSCILTTIDCDVIGGSGKQTWNGTSYGVCMVDQCDLDYYKTSTSICSIVGNGYFSNSTSIDRIICTNKPLNSIYTSDGGGINNCNYNCNSGYAGNSCDNIIISECTGIGQKKVGTTKYGSCNSNDIIICSGNGIGYIISSCNVGTNTTGSNGSYYQFGKISTTFTIGNSSIYSGDWLSPGGIDGGSANSWGVLNGEKDIISYINSISENKTKMQGPCLSGYHVPTVYEWGKIHESGQWGLNGSNMISDLKIPLAGLRDYDDRHLFNTNVYGVLWLSSPNGIYGHKTTIKSDYIWTASSSFRTYGHSIRCIKN